MNLLFQQKLRNVAVNENKIFKVLKAKGTKRTPTTLFP